MTGEYLPADIDRAASGSASSV